MKLNFKRNSLYLITVLIVIIIILLNLFQNEVRNFFYSFSKPIGLYFWRAGDSVSDFFHGFARAKNLKEISDNLNIENQELKWRLSEMEKLKNENDSLRKALEIELNQDFKLVLAQVLGKNIGEDSVIIDKGEKDGISKNMVVITENKSAVGKISKVYQNFSVVSLLSNKEISLDAKILQKDIQGVVRGKGFLKIIFDLIPSDKIMAKDDLVFTSGLGGNFPEGFLVGKITNIQRSDIEAFQQADILPSIDLKELKNVFVIINFP